MRPLYVTTQTFNRQDLLRKLFESIEQSTRKPDGIYVVDHGYDEAKIHQYVKGATSVPYEIVTLEDPGCAHSANWAFKKVPDDRVGCGDDIQFYPDTLELMAATEGDFIISDSGNVNPAACCLIRNSCIEKIGYFDEKISPNYLYFEDTDYIRRLDLAGLKQTVAKGARVIHEDGGSQTLKALSIGQHEEHVRRFNIAKANYIKKWGGEPFHETLTVPRGL